jgi:hypothetical protein
VRIVHDADQRALLGDVRKEAQHRQPDAEPVRSIAVPQPQGRAERLTLRSREALHSVGDRRAELVKPGEHKLHLGLDARGAKHATAGGLFHQVVQQRTLADAGLPRQYQRPARTGAHAHQQLIQRRALAPPAEQPRGGSRHRHPRAYRDQAAWQPASVRQ